MFVDCQNSQPSVPPAAALGFPPPRASVQASWPAEPSLAEMIGDPMFQQLMASDRVSMKNFTGLIASVRQKLAS